MATQDLTQTGEPTFAAMTLSNAAVKVGTFASPSSPDSLGVTGIGFNPTLIQIFLLHPNNTTRGIQGSGFYDGTSQFATYTDTTETSTSSSNIIYWIDTATTTRVVAAATSLDSDGFTLNFTTSLSIYTFGYIAWKL